LSISKKGVGIKELKDLRHNLPKIWRKFKAHHPGELKEFDAVISELHRLEEIRYPTPDFKGMLSECYSKPNLRRSGPMARTGALSVGRIVQVHPAGAPFRRGEEKSVFRFGGSAIVVFGEPGTWHPSDDLLKHTKEGVETLVRPRGSAGGILTDWSTG
jgi:Phosphatidylserine decarboxylase